jgi:hypothetical protein
MYREVDAVRGWFLRLCFGYHRHGSDSEGLPLENFALGAISVPVKLVDLVEGDTEWSWYVVGGFHRIH